MTRTTSRSACAIICPIINVMDDDGVINENGGKYAGMPAARGQKADRQGSGRRQASSLKLSQSQHNVGTCYRCGTVVEPRVSTQWFVKMEPLAKPAIDAVKDGDIRFIPERMDKIYYQLDGEHQGLVYLPSAVVGSPDSGVVLRGLRRDHRLRDALPTVCPKCGGTHLTQRPRYA